MIHKPFHVKFAKYIFLAQRIETEDPEFFMDFTLWVSFLRRIDRTIINLNELVL